MVWQRHMICAVCLLNVTELTKQTPAPWGLLGYHM